MKKPPRTERRGGQFYYRRRVPLPLVSLLGFAEYRESLQTSDMATARTRAALRDAQVALELQAAESKLKGRQRAAPETAEQVTPEYLKFVRAAVLAHTLQCDEEERRSATGPEGREAYASIMAERFAETGLALSLGVPYVSKEERERIEGVLAAVGVTMAPDSPAWAEVAFTATQGYNEAMQAIYKRAGGFYVVTPDKPAIPSKAAAHTLGAVIDDYLANVKQTGYTRKVKRALQLFGAVIGRNTPVKDLKQRAVTNFLRDICKLPTNWAAQHDKGIPVAALMAADHEELMSPTTYRDNYRAPLGAFLAESRRDHGDDGFPALTVDRIEYVGLRKANEDQQRALTPAELKKLFEGPEFAAVANDAEQESLYWFSVFSLFTGARPRELCQVNPQVDFGELGGISYIDLSPFSPAGVGITKTIKTGEERRIPLHPELMRLGAFKYLEGLKKAGADRLFPGFRVKKGNPFEASGELFSDLLKGAGLYDDTAPPGNRVQGAYVMRKSFITLCRNQGVVSKEITGHRDENTTRVQDQSYIFGPEPLQEKNKQLRKLKISLRLPNRFSDNRS